ncbi:MAG: hypothetical protein JW715_03505 [Sedimentisphaerales bacterium]|nr:hypothetical protein [Sedimentisphaerales bacterium]
MINKLNPKDIRALKLGAVGVVAILAMLVALEGHQRWADAKQKADNLEQQLDNIDLDKAKRIGLTSIVPVFEMPVSREERFIVRDMLNQQLRRANINSQPLQEIPGGKSPVQGYELLRLKCKATCGLQNVLNLLADLKSNPYLVGIEELRIKTDTRNQRQVDFELTVSTLLKI